MARRRYLVALSAEVEVWATSAREAEERARERIDARRDFLVAEVADTTPREHDRPEVRRA